MEINCSIIEGDYESCYGSLFQNVKNESDQRQLLDFMDMTKMRCLEIYEKRYREFEQQITSKYNSEYVKEVTSLNDEIQKDLLQARMINQVYSDLNQQLSEKLQASLIFGSIIYSVGDFRLKQEKSRQQSLQSKHERNKVKLSQYKKEAVCFINMNRTKDDFILQLKDKINELKLQLNLQCSPQKENSYHQAPPEFTLNLHALENSVNLANSQGAQSSSESLKRFESEKNQSTEQSNEMNAIKQEEEPIKVEEVPCDFDMYNYSFGKLFKAKSLQTLEDTFKQQEQIEQQQITNQAEPFQAAEKQQLQQASNINSISNRNVQVLKASITLPPYLNDKQSKISLFNSNSDQSLQRKSPSPSASLKKLKDKVNTNINYTNTGRLKKNNFQSLSCTYGQNIFTKTDTELLHQMVIEPSPLQQTKQNINNSTIYCTPKYSIQVNQSTLLFEGQSPKSFIIHKLGSNLKSQISSSALKATKKA